MIPIEKIVLAKLQLASSGLVAELEAVGAEEHLGPNIGSLVDEVRAALDLLASTPVRQEQYYKELLQAKHVLDQTYRYINSLSVSTRGVDLTEDEILEEANRLGQPQNVYCRRLNGKIRVYRSGVFLSEHKTAFLAFKKIQRYVKR